MKIKLRESMKGSNIFIVALMPTMTYVMGRVVGVQYNHLEFIWWISIPALWIMFLCLKFKIIKNHKEKQE